MRLGIIQGVHINDEFCRIPRKASAYPKPGRVIWFVQEYVRHLPLSKLRFLRYKIAQVLLNNGFIIPHPDKFNEDLKKLCGGLKTKRAH